MSDLVALVARLRESPLPSLNRICRDRKDAADAIETLGKSLEGASGVILQLREQLGKAQAEVAHWKDLVSSADLALNPFPQTDEEGVS